MFRHDLPAMPTHYGCSIELMNDADGELLDVMLLDDRPRERNEKLDVRVIDVLEREDGDHKLMALPVDVAPFTSATQRRLAAERKTIWRWYIEMEKPVTRWAGEEAAIALIRRCRAGVQ
jgi:inorganic pyrophosphatase